MALILESAQTLALGHFNPHIITPAWLVKQKLFKDAEVQLRILPISQGAAFQFKNVQWQIDFQSLLVASAKENCGTLVGEVLKRLPHMPVRALGNNFHYAGTMETWGESPLPLLGSEGWGGFESVGKIDQLRWAGVFVRDGVRIEITLAQGEAGLVVLFNFHRETKNSKEVRVAAERFNEDKESIKKLLKKLFNQGVTPQGQLQLSRWSHKDFQQEIIVPSTATTLHDGAILAWMLLQ